MIYLQISRWVQKNNDVNIWWRSTEQLYELLNSNSQYEVQVLNYLIAASKVQDELQSIITFFHREMGSDNHIYTCVSFDSTSQINNFNLLKGTQSFLDYVKFRNELLDLWNIEMTVSETVEIDSSSLEEIYQTNFLMNKFNQLSYVSQYNN